MLSFQFPNINELVCYWVSISVNVLLHDINLDIFVENKVNFYSYLQVHNHLQWVHHMIPSASIGSPVVFDILLFHQASCSSITIKNSYPLELYHVMTAKVLFMTYLTTWLENLFGKRLNISSVMIHNFSRKCAHWQYPQGQYPRHRVPDVPLDQITCIQEAPVSVPVAELHVCPAVLSHFCVSHSWVVPLVTISPDQNSFKITYHQSQPGKFCF